MSHARQAYLLLVLTTLFWAGNFVLGRAVHEAIPPLGLSFWRWAIALLLVLPWVIGPMRRQWPLIRDNWPILTLLAVLGVTNFNTFVYIGLQTTQASNAILIQATNPLMILLLAWPLLGQPLTGRGIAGVALSIAGVAVIVSGADLERLLALQFTSGDLWLLAAAFDWALYSVCLRWRPKGLDPLAFLGTTFAIGVASLLPLWLWELQQGQPMPLNSTTLLTVGYVALFPSVLAYIFWNHAVGVIGAARTGQFIYLMPVFGIGLSLLFLGERLAGFHLLGMGLIAAGIVIAVVRR